MEVLSKDVRFLSKISLPYKSKRRKFSMCRRQALILSIFRCSSNESQQLYNRYMLMQTTYSIIIHVLKRQQQFVNCNRKNNHFIWERKPRVANRTTVNKSYNEWNRTKVINLVWNEFLKTSKCRQLLQPILNFQVQY